MTQPRAAEDADPVSTGLDDGGLDDGGLHDGCLDDQCASAEPRAHRNTIRQISVVLHDALGDPVDLEITDNRTVMISTRRRRGRQEVRLHRMFLDAPDAVLGALGRYVGRRNRAAGVVLDQFIADRLEQLPPMPPKRRVRIRTLGACHDLAAMFAQLAPLFPEPMADCRITWGAWGKRKRRRQRTIQLGTYLPDEKLIRVHPVLDQAWVPDYYVASVVFHEMLHHAIPAKRVGGRRVYHGKDFRTRERGFVYHDQAEAWEKQNLTKILKAAATQR